MKIIILLIILFFNIGSSIKFNKILDIKSHKQIQLQKKIKIKLQSYIKILNLPKFNNLTNIFNNFYEYTSIYTHITMLL